MEIKNEYCFGIGALQRFRSRYSAEKEKKQTVNEQELKQLKRANTPGDTR